MRGVDTYGDGEEFPRWADKLIDGRMFPRRKRQKGLRKFLRRTDKINRKAALKGMNLTGFKYPSQPDLHIVKQKYKKARAVTGSEYKFVGTGLFYSCFAALLRGAALLLLPVWAFFWMRPKIYGKKHLRSLKDSGMVIISNHVHVLDAPVICAVANRTRKVRFVMLKENVDIRFAGTIVKALGGIPLAENYGGMKKFNRTVLSLLEDKKPVLFYPEVAMWPYYTGLRPFQQGAFLFAAKAKTPVLPMAYTFKINKKGKKNRICLHILPPIDAQDKTAAQLSQLSRSSMLETIESFYANPKNNKSGQTVETVFGIPAAAQMPAIER